MANCYTCPECGDCLDWSEAYSHKCEPITVKVVNEKLAPKESEPAIDYSTDPATVRTREAVMAKIRAMAAGQKN